MIRPIAIATACLALTACQHGLSLEEYADAANKLDPDCGKLVHVELIPMLMFGWVVPVVKGTYDKACHVEQFNRSPVGVGSVIGAVPGV